MPVVTIRDAVVADTPSVLDLLYELGRPVASGDGDADRFAEIILGYIRDRDKEALVAEYDGAVVGLASVIFLVRHNRVKPEMYIPELVVRSECRNRGVGRMLVDACIRLAGERGCYRIRLESGNERGGLARVLQEPRL